MPRPDAARRHPTTTLAVLALGIIAYALSQTMIAPALPAIQRGLGISATAAAWTLSAYLVSASVMTAVIGRLGDMFGKKRVLVATLLAFGVGSAICALADAIGVLIVGRVVQGAAGGLFPLAYGIIRDELPPPRVPAGIGLVSSLMGIGGGLGLVLGGLLVDHTGWHAIFWLGLVLTVVAVVATALVVPESPVRSPGRVDWVGAALLTVGLGAALVAVSQAESWGWGEPRTLALLAAGLAVLGAFAAFERRQAAPLVDMRILALRPVLLTNIATLLVGFSMFAGFMLVPQFVQMPTSTGFGFGVTATIAGLVILPSTIATLVAAPLAGRVGAVRGSKGPLVVGALITAVSLVLYAAVHGSVAVLLVWAAAQGFGVGLAFAAMPNLIIEVVPQTQTGEATAVNALLRNVGASIGTQLCGTVLASHALAGTGLPSETGFVLAFLLGAAAALAAAAIGALLPRRRRPVARSAADAGLVAAEA